MSDTYNFRKFINNGRLKKNNYCKKEEKKLKKLLSQRKISHNKILSILYGP